jgi:hypothetical protein
MANHLIRAALIFTAGLACTGCIAIWQSDHKIEASTGEAVIIDYDPILLTSDRVSNAAQAECGRFQRVAVLDHIRSGRTWTKIAKYRCEDGPLTLKGSIALPPSTQLAAGAIYRSLPPPFAASEPLIAAAKTASTPSTPPIAAPESAPTLAEPAPSGGVSFINAIGTNWGVTPRQVTKAPDNRARAAKTAAVGHPTQAKKGNAEPEHSLKASNLPAANLKGSLVS